MKQISAVCDTDVLLDLANSDSILLSGRSLDFEPDIQEQHHDHYALFKTISG